MILQITLSLARDVLEEANFPPHLIASLTDQPVSAQILAEEHAMVRRIEGDDFPILIDPEGNQWNDYRPMRVIFTDGDGCQWRLPRRLIASGPCGPEPNIASDYSTEQEISFPEAVNLPTDWDLWEINMPWDVASQAGGRPTHVQVTLCPGGAVKVFWNDPQGTRWRIPHDWRRRRVRLPAYEVLVEQDVPDDVAERFAGKVVSVNYHPGSLCCYPDRYRFRDEMENRYPVFIRDCTVMGYGDAAEHLA